MAKSKISLKLLNHASVYLDLGEVRLLTDPWYSGTCFKGGWGLRFHNPGVWEDAAKATHLWISHFHGDHLHLPTLKELFQKNPDIQVLSNLSANFDMTEPFRAVGFKNIIDLRERKPLFLSRDIKVIRYPATGIDNMLLLQGKGWNILNFNDCNMPREAIQKILKKSGPVDIALINFNYANKLIDRPSDEEIQKNLKDRFSAILQAIEPALAIPFASMHYYKPKCSWDQNRSMLKASDLEGLDPRVLALNFGDELILKNREHEIKKLIPPLTEVSFEEKQHKDSPDWPTLLNDAETFRKKIRAQFFGACGWLPPLVIRAADLEKNILFDLSKKITETTQAPHIQAPSGALRDWFAKPYGTDAFFVGADFEVLRPDIRPIQKLILAGDLMDHGLTPKGILGMLIRIKGFGFFWNRREEIWAILRSRRFVVGNRIAGAAR